MTGATFPRAFGRYTLLASLGRGGMGEVFAARVDGIDKLCVVKTLPHGAGHDREMIARFTDEARLAVRLNQRNICSVFDVGVVDEVHFLAMDLVHGRDLRAVWKRGIELNRPLERGLALHIVSEVLDGLDYAHRLADPVRGPLRIVHRDVSAQNVMVSFEGDVKLIDFGLAASTLKMERTESNVVMGKVAYMPPEQLHGEAIDARADVFAAAVVAYELLVGERFYEGVAPLLVSASAASGNHLPRRWAELDPTLQMILRRATAARVAERTASAALLAEELRTFAAEHSARGDAASLRRYMTELFGSSADPWQAVSTSEPVAPPTRDIVVSATITAVDDATAGTEAVHRAPPPARRTPPALVAAAIVVGIVAAVGVGFVTARGVAPVDAPVVSGPPVVGPVATAVPVVETPVAPRVAPPPAPVEAPAVVAPVTTTTHTRHHSKQRSPLEKATFLRAHCPELACVKRLNLDGTDAPDTARFTADVERCYEQCPD